MMSKDVLAFDLGASNGRAIVATYEEGKIKLNEIHRFSNDPVEMNNYIYWDFLRLFHELKTALIKAKKKGFHIQSVGIDSWGVDYGLVDGDGELIGNPIHYRDKRAAAGMEKLLQLYDEKDFKKRTGMDCVSYNTVNQLVNDRILLKSDDSKKDELRMLNIPDLFNYYLTGVMASEFSMATTTQLFDYENKDWNYELIEELQLPKTLFAPIQESGKIIGTVKESIISELKIEPLQVVSVTSHDTASAIQSIAADEEDFLFIATGTWVIVGSKQSHMIMNDEVMKYNLSNEGSKMPYVNLLKNHVGLWMLQESKRHWQKESMEIDFSEMVSEGEKAEIDSFIDIMDTRFFEPGNMPLKVADYCRETNQRVPETIGEIVKVIEQSLAKQIAKTLFQIEEAVGKNYTQVHIIGGGIQDRLLCSLIEKYSGKKLVIGPKEGTTFGNVIDQFMALEVFGEEDRLSVLKNSI